MSSEKSIYDYDASSIKVLKGREAVRKRPGMYFGGIDSYGLNNAIWQTFNSLLEYQLSHHELDSFQFTIKGDSTFQLSTRLTISAEEFESFMNTDTPDMSIAQAIQPLWWVVAVSEKMEVCLIDKVGPVNEFHFSKGRLIEQSNSTFSSQNSDYNFVLTITLDKTIFERAEAISFHRIAGWLRNECAVTEGLAVHLFDERDNRHSSFVYRDGLCNYLEEFLVGSGVYTPDFVLFHCKKVYGEESIEIAFAPMWTGGDAPFFINFINGGRVFITGTHIEGIKEALLECLRKYALTRETELSEDIAVHNLANFVFVVSIWITDPKSDNSMQLQLSNPEARTMAYEAIMEAYEQSLDQLKPHLDKLLWQLKYSHL